MNNKLDFKKDIAKANKIKNLSKRILYINDKLHAIEQDGGFKYYEFKDYYDYTDKMNRERTMLYSKLESQNHSIHKRTKFESIKTNASANAIELIWWKKSGRLLGYLLEELAKHDLIDRESPINKIIKDHFLNNKKERFTDSIKQNRSGAGENKGTDKNKKSKPKGAEKFDKITEWLLKFPDMDSTQED
jgi:hypothetical protein